MQVPAQKGFTLVEILLVVSIIAILSGFLIPGFSNYIENQNIRQGQELFKSDLRTVQNKALTGVGSTSTSINYWGLKITDAAATNYYFFSSDEASSTACDNVNISTADRSESLPGGVAVLNAANSCVFFSLENGDAVVTGNGGSNIFGLSYPGETACLGVEINSVGMIRAKDIACE